MMITPAQNSCDRPCLRWERDIVLRGFEGAEDFVPYRMIVDIAGRILVTGSNDEGLLVVDKNGDSISKIYPEFDGKKIKLSNISEDADERIYLTSMESSEIYVYDKEFTYLFKFGEKGGGNGKLSRPSNVAVDKVIGQMYVSDAMRHTILVYDMAGKFLYDPAVRAGGRLVPVPADLAVDKDGRLFIADTFNDRVSIFFRPRCLLTAGKSSFLPTD
jgi:sugar lactone lactonase YvrE